MKKHLIIIASGSVGFQLLSWLIKKKSKIFFVLSTRKKTDTQIQELCKKNKINYSIYSNSKINKIFFNSPKNSYWLLSLWNPFILDLKLIEYAYDTLNLHPSYLPYVRGNDTAAWTLVTRNIAGVSINRLHKRIDCGDIWVRKKIKYNVKTKGIELYEILLKEIVTLFKMNWSKIYEKKINMTKNTCNNFIKSRRDTNLNRVIYLDKKYKASELIFKILAHDFSKKSSAFFIYNKKRYKVRINIE